jgi:hypothetical protein
VPRELYLHETIDILGEGAVPYMEKSVVGFDAAAVADRGLALFGTFLVQGSTGRWPQVVNVWEIVDSWAGWERLCARTNLRRQANAELAAWWREAASWRTGGFDRLLGAAPGSPTLAEVSDRAQGIRGELFVHELASVRPGSALDYLDAVRREFAPLMAEHGHRLVGLWEVLLGETEVCTLWATDLASHIALARSTDAARGFGAPHAAGDARLLAWRERIRAFDCRWRHEMLIPCPGTPMGPRAWAD